MAALTCDSMTPSIDATRREKYCIGMVTGGVYRTLYRTTGTLISSQKKREQGPAEWLPGRLVGAKYGLLVSFEAVGGDR